MDKYLNVIIDGIAIFIIMIVYISRQIYKRNIKKSPLLNMLMICIFLVLMLDIPAWILDGTVFSGSHIICTILNTLYYLAQIIYCFLWLKYVDNWSNDSKRRNKIIKVIFTIPMIIEILIIFLNINTGWIFTINSENIYTRGDYFAINMIPYYFYILLPLIIAILSAFKSKDYEKRHHNISIIIYMLLPIIGVTIQAVLYGVSLLWPFTAISLLMIYMNIQSHNISEESILASIETQKATNFENELSNSRIKIMLSQIQPHFMYNSLSVIQALCETNPPLAASAIGKFSEYLQCNMNSLSTDDLIPFEQELEHIEHYLSLEKLRFQEYLNIMYDIKITDFYVPTLSVQPIVENAVRYGITKREDGGTLKISTFETTISYTISIEDDGIGFDLSIKKKDGRTHTGIENVRKRLETMCQGTLKIESHPGTGTKSVITIPKIDKENKL